jgi:hypothetical protein
MGRDFATHQQQQLDDIGDKDDCHDLHPRLHIRSRVEYARCFIETHLLQRMFSLNPPHIQLDSLGLPE